MRKLWLLLAFAGLAMAAEEGAGKKPEGDFLLEKWVNFAILAGGLGYVAVKQGGPVFRARKLEITESLEVSRRRAEAAAERAADVDRRMAGLQADVEALRAEALVGMQAEGERIGAETAEKMVKLGQANEQEIASATKAARQEVKAAAAVLALDLARQKVVARMDEPTQSALVSRFARGLDSPQRLSQ
jgi:F-type H+-transporting ATPase subunit b